MASLLLSTLIGGWIVNNYIGQVVGYMRNKFTEKYTNYLIIERKYNPKGYYAIETAITIQHSDKTTKVGNDGAYELEYGIYAIDSIYFEYTADKMIIYCSKKEKTNLKQYYENLVNKHVPPSESISYYSHEGSEWGFPLFRRPITMKEKDVTPEMKNVLDDVEKFKNDEQLYKDNNIPYRRGYYIYGNSGTGKTTIAEILAVKYGSPIYSVDFNSPNINGTVIKKLIASVPPQSIIVIDEIEKQMETAKQNNNNYVSEAAILSAIDGVPRLSHGVIIILTANKIVEFNKALFRAGRMDMIIEFTTSIIKLKK